MRLRRGKSCGRGGVARRHLREAQAVRGDLGGEAGVLGRIDHVDAAGLRRDRAGRERRPVGGGVDAAGEAGGDDEAGGAEVGGQPRRHPAAERRGVAGADQRDGGTGGERGVAERPEQPAAGRRWWRAAADSRARRAAAGGRPAASPASPLGRRARARGRRHSRAAPASAAMPRQRVERGAGRAVLADQPDEGRGPTRRERASRSQSSRASGERGRASGGILALAGSASATLVATGLTPCQGLLSPARPAVQAGKR